MAKQIMSNLNLAAQTEDLESGNKQATIPDLFPADKAKIVYVNETLQLAEYMKIKVQFNQRLAECSPG